jgi:hypothetical protein
VHLGGQLRFVLLHIRFVSLVEWRDILFDSCLIPPFCLDEALMAVTEFYSRLSLGDCAVQVLIVYINLLIRHFGIQIFTWSIHRDVF